jgi:hypothetical protein
MQRIAGDPGATVGDIDHGRDVHRVEELIEAARCSRFLSDDDGAPGRPPHRVAGDEALDDGRRVAARGFRQVHSLNGGVGRLFVAHEQILGVVVIGPERDLIGRRRDAAGHERDVQAVRYLDGLQVVGSVIRTERALFERMADSEELFGVVGQHVGDERSEVAVRVGGVRPGGQSDHGQAGDENARDKQRWAHETVLLSFAAT